MSRPDQGWPGRLLSYIGRLILSSLSTEYLVLCISPSFYFNNTALEGSIRPILRISFLQNYICTSGSPSVQYEVLKFTWELYCCSIFINFGAHPPVLRIRPTLEVEVYCYWSHSLTHYSNLMSWPRETQTIRICHCQTAFSVRRPHWNLGAASRFRQHRQSRTGVTFMEIKVAHSLRF